jgi:hypothetical protein
MQMADFKAARCRHRKQVERIQAEPGDRLHFIVYDMKHRIEEELDKEANRTNVYRCDEVPQPTPSTARKARQK